MKKIEKSCVHNCNFCMSQKWPIFGNFLQNPHTFLKNVRKCEENVRPETPGALRWRHNSSHSHTFFLINIYFKNNKIIC